MDLMEEFEFKPITEGLGFHKKKAASAASASTASSSLSTEEDLKSSLPSFLEEEISPAQTESKKKVLEDKVASLPFDFSQSSASIFSSTLPREAPKTSGPQKVAPPPVAEVPREKISVPKFNAPKFKSATNAVAEKQTLKQQESVSEILKPSLKQDLLVEQKSNKIIDEKPVVILKESVVAPTAIILDFFMVMGLSILFTLGLMVATGLDVVTIATQSAADLGTQVGIALLVFSASQLYMIITRSFFGQTLGEWSLEQQLGTAEQQNQFSYVFKLMLRTLLVALTGFILLPILSALLKKDVAGRMSGICLQRKD